MNNSNIQRIQRRLWKKLKKKKEKDGKVRQRATKDDDSASHDSYGITTSQVRKRVSNKNMQEGYDTLADQASEKNMNQQSWFGASEVILSATTIQDGLRRREQIFDLQQSSYISTPTENKYSDNDNEVETAPKEKKMTTMKDVINALKLESEQRKATNSSTQDVSTSSTSHETHQAQTSPHQNRKPSLHLRAMVQERMAHIIANDIAGYQSMVETQDNMLSVFIDTFKFTADKWMIPKQAQGAFQSLAFQCLFFVGERNLILNGANALLNLGPLEFHGLFSAPLAAMGDTETMEAWLACTDVLSDVEFKKGIKGDELKKGKLLEKIDPNSLPRMIMQPSEKKKGIFGRKKKRRSSSANSSSGTKKT